MATGYKSTTSNLEEPREQNCYSIHQHTSVIGLSTWTSAYQDMKECGQSQKYTVNEDNTILGCRNVRTTFDTQRAGITTSEMKRLKLHHVHDGQGSTMSSDQLRLTASLLLQHYSSFQHKAQVKDNFHFASASFATEFSQVLAYSSAEWSLGRPPSRLNSAHESTMGHCLGLTTFTQVRCRQTPFEQVCTALTLACPKAV